MGKPHRLTTQLEKMVLVSIHKHVSAARPAPPPWGCSSSPAVLWGEGQRAEQCQDLQPLTCSST